MLKSVALTKTYTQSIFTALFIAANIGLPHIFHMIPGGGVMFLPIYFFTAFAAVSYGKWSGILTGSLSPLLGYLIFGAPQAQMIPDMILKGMLLSASLTFFLRYRYKILAIPIGVLTAWLAAALLELLIGQGSISYQDFFTGIPGLIMMTIAGWTALFFNRKIAK